MRRILLATVALLATTAATQAETLADALASAYVNSGLIEQQRAVVRASDEDVAQAVATLRPVFGYAADLRYRNPVFGETDTTLTASVNFDWLLYDFGRTDLDVEAKKELVLAARALLEDAENTVLLNAALAYLSVRRSFAFVELRQNNLRLLTQQLRATRDRFEVGEVTRTDVSLAEARLAAARSGLAAEQGQLAVAQEIFKQVVGRAPGALAPPPSPPSIPSSEAAAKDVALRENPLIAQGRHQVRAAELSLERVKRLRLPTLNANGSLTINDEFDDSQTLGLQLSGPIYQGGAIPSIVRQQQARVDQTRAALTTTARGVEQEVGAAYANLAVAIASIDAAGRQVRAAGLALEGVREELQLGARTTLDVLDQENELFDARTIEVSATIDRFAAIYEVLDAMGVLTVERLNLGVPVYDPALNYNAVKTAPGTPFSERSQRLDKVMKALGR